MQISPGNALNGAIIRFMFIATCFTACKIFRHKAISFTDSLHTEAVDTRIETNTASTHTATTLTTELQSGESRWQAEIVPEGPFTFSTEKGFTGTAAFVRINGAESHASLRRDSVQASGKNASEQTLSTATRIKDKAASRAKINVQEKRDGYKWVWGLVLPALLLLWFLSKKRRWLCMG